MSGTTKKKKRRWYSLTLVYSGIIFLAIALVLSIFMGGILFLSRRGILTVSEDFPTIDRIALYVALISLGSGALLSFAAGHISIRPFGRFIEAINRLACGDFKSRMELRRGLGSFSAVRELTESYNRLAEELENTEMLRSDFVNNFSHEFKTPIVSIAGFAGLLKREGLTEEQRREYVDIIEEESKRLAHMATSVLDMTRLENQMILTNVESFNLSEQLRSSILLFEDKWVKKNIDLQMDLEEYTITANEEMLKHVWINLIDNAIKFADEGGTVAIGVLEKPGAYEIEISDTGTEIPADALPYVFNKFFQADKSHGGEGNGIGLAVVHRIVELHGGTIAVKSGEGKTTFTVTLPR